VDEDVSKLKDPFAYFTLMFPMKIINEILHWTNINIKNDTSANKVGGDLTIEEFALYLGLRIKMMLLGCANIDEYFRTHETPTSAFPPLNFGKKHGMSKHRFETIERNLQLGGKPKKPTVVS